MKNVVQFLWSKPPLRDWSNQDLADFYRVEAALVQAGLSVETDRGLSDEGEPWFVFCHSDTQDVIVHCARIDGMYVVASAAFEGILRGTDFRDVVEGVLARHPLVMPRQREGSNVHFHPSALLVALIATAFFKLSGEAQASDENVEVSVATSASRFDFSALKHLLIDLDKRQAALVVAAMVYIHADMGIGTLTEQGIAKAEIAQDASVAVEVASADSVDQLFQQFLAQKSEPESSHGDHASNGIQLTADHELTAWTFAAIVDHAAVEQGPAKAVMEQAFSLAQEVAPFPGVIVVTSPKGEIDVSSFVVAGADTRERTSSSTQTATPLSETTHSSAAVETHKVLQSLITEFSTGALGSALSETSKDQVIAALATATSTVNEPIIPVAQVQQVQQVQVPASPDVLKGSVLDELKSFYDTQKLSESLVAATGSIDAMVKDFVLNTLDFHSITSGKNIIFYDPTPTGQHDEKFVTIVFDDKSTLSLIGSFDTFHLVA